MWHVRTLSRGQKLDLESHWICLIAKAKKEILENTECPSMHDLASIHYYRLLSSFSAGRVAFVKLAERNIFVKAMHTVGRRLNLPSYLDLHLFESGMATEEQLFL
jgi:hypothetical protein